jgi:hypothetical protein
MHILGFYLMIAGFIGMLGIGVLKVTRSMALVLALHLLVVLAIFTLGVKRAGSLKAWRTQRLPASYGVHPAFVVLAGLVFVCGGLCIMIFATPEDPNEMTRYEILYAGSPFLLVGAGVAVFSWTDWARLRR